MDLISFLCVWYLMEFDHFDITVQIYAQCIQYISINSVKLHEISLISTLGEEKEKGRSYLEAEKEGEGNGGQDAESGKESLSIQGPKGTFKASEQENWVEKELGRLNQSVCWL